MPPVNATAVAVRPVSYPLQTQFPSTSRLAGAYPRNSTASDSRWSPHTAGLKTPSSNSKLPIPCPVYTGILRACDLPDSLKKGAIFDQKSLEHAWSSIQARLRTGSVTHEDFVQILKSGFLQTDTGKVLAPLLAGAVLRSTTPLEKSTQDQLTNFVEMICDLPPSQWAAELEQNENFPRFHNGADLNGITRALRELSRAQRAQGLADRELLDNETVQAVLEFTKKMQPYVPDLTKKAQDEDWSDADVINEMIAEHLCEFDDFERNPPKTRDAQTLFSRFVDLLNELHPDERQHWPEDFAVIAQNINTRLAGIEIVDNRPDRSWLEEIVDPQALLAPLSKLATPMKTALTQLSAMSLTDVGNELKSAMSIGLTKVGSYLAFGPEPEPVSEQKADNSPADSELLLAMQDIEKKSSFFDEIVTTGPRYTGGFWGKVLYVANALDTVGVLGIAEKARPHLPAVPVQAPVVLPPEPPEAPPLSGADLLTKAEATEREVHDFFESFPPAPAPAPTIGNGNGNGIGSGPKPPEASPPTTSAIGGLDLKWIAQAIGDALSRIDAALTIPLASAADVEEGLRGLGEALQEEQAEALLPGEPGPVYGSTVEAIPSWWEPIAQQLNSVLLRLATALGTYSLGAASSALQVIRDNPGASVTTAFVAVSALYNEYRQTLDDPTAPGTAFPAPESPALHQERLENDIEQILAEGDLLAPLLEEMRQSPERDLLDDEQLIEDVAQKLQQPSPQNPTKTYLQLIHEAQLAEHEVQSFIEPSPDAHSTHTIHKRDTAAVNENLASFSALTADVEPTPDIEENESDKVATLTQYLETMDELQRPAADAEEEIDNGPSASPTETAKQVIRVLRHRRAAIWIDTTRANGDEQLVTHYVRALGKYAEGKVTYTAATVEVPRHSTFGRCWLNVINAFNNPFFIEWAGQAKLELSTVRVNTADNTLTGKVNGVVTTFKLDDNTGWANVARPLLRTISVVDPTYIGVAYPASSAIPLALVGAFHGESPTLTKDQAQQRARQLAANQAFAEIKPDDPLRPPESRSEAQVEKEAQRLGDLYSWHALTTALTSLIGDKPDNASVNLTSCLLPVHKDSLFASKYPQEARSMVTAQRLISAMGWKVPKTVAEVSNLIQVLTFALPESTARGNYQGVLGYPHPLSVAQLETIRQTVQRLPKPLAGGLLNNLLQSQPVTSPAQGLFVALNSDKATRLGKALETSLNAITTPDSAAEWVMAALLLDLDPTPGLPRNHVAGYNLTQSANGGEKPATVVSRLEAHLLAGGKVSATAAPVAAYHLLAAFAPEFLVRDLPDNLVCGSHTWTTFRIAVARIEQIEPGAAMRMTFGQVMEYGSTDPISTGEEVAAQSASVDPLIDWAINAGIIAQNATDTYTTGQLDIAREKFNALRAEMAQARDSLTAAVPTREGLALAELERVFGPGLPYNELCLRQTSIPDNVRATRYSLLDLYITGELTPGKWSSYNTQIPIREFEKKFNQLKPVGPLFKEAFTSYFDNLRSGSESAFKHLISQLPLEDRQSLEYSEKITFYTVRSAIDKDRHFQTSEEKEAHKGRHGILIRSEYKGKITYYEVFPSTAEIRKNTQLPDTLKLNGELKTFRSITDPSGYIEKQCATEQPIDWEAYEKGTAPRNGVKSNVIIEELKPTSQQVTFYPPGYDFNKVPYAFSPGSRIDYLAKVVVDEHFVVGREKLESLARGSTNSENEKSLKALILDFLLSLVPFKSCFDGDALGCVLDTAGFVIPGGIAAGRAVKVAKSAGKFVPKAMKISWIMSSSLASSANPADGVANVLKFGKNVVCKLGNLAYRAGKTGVEQIQNLYGATKAIDHAQLLKRADIAEGIASGGISGQTSPVIALLKDRRWYAFDAARNRPYGPPLENFLPANSIPLQPTTFSDGSIAITPSLLFDTKPHTIQRFSGEVDVVVGDNVYRFNPEQPHSLTDLTSPYYSGELEGFDAVCSQGGKSRRGVTCLSKYIGDTATEDQKRAQALEHKRLWPSKGTNPRVVHERRIFNFDGVKGQAHAAPTITPLEFKAETTGSIISDKNFGFLTKQADDEIEKKTFTVRVNSIVNGIDDMRDVRAFKVEIPDYTVGKFEYLVAEVDAGLFYYCVYDKGNINNIKFKKIDFAKSDFAADLINGYHELKDPFLVAGIKAPSRPFMALPTLETLHTTLIDKKGYTPDQIKDLKSKIELYSDEHKREFLINVWTKEKVLDIEVFIKPIHLNNVKKPVNFDARSDYSKNLFYAQTAQTQVNNQLKATGLGPANLQIPDDPNDLQRFAQATSVVIWEYSRVGKPNYAETILKTGAGNCDQMAHITAAVVLQNGGTASLWTGPGHAFTLIGMPMGMHHSTIDFSEPIFENVMFADAWLNVFCPAPRAMEAVVDRARAMRFEGIKMKQDGEWVDVIDSKWLEAFISGTKQTNMKKTS